MTVDTKLDARELRQAMGPVRNRGHDRYHGDLARKTGGVHRQCVLLAVPRPAATDDAPREWLLSAPR
jgi:hypothetical protein